MKVKWSLYYGSKWYSNSLCPRLLKLWCHHVTIRFYTSCRSWSVRCIPTTVHGLDLSGQIDIFLICMICMTQLMSSGWKRYNLHDLTRVSRVDLCYRSCAAYHIGRSVSTWSRSWSILSVQDDLYHHLSHLFDMWKVKVFKPCSWRSVSGWWARNAGYFRYQVQLSRHAYNTLCKPHALVPCMYLACFLLSLAPAVEQSSSAKRMTFAQRLQACINSALLFLKLCFMFYCYYAQRVRTLC